MEFAFGLIVGIAICFVIMKLLEPRYFGYIRIDHSDPSEPPYLFLEMCRSMDELYSHKKVLLEVKIEDFISRK